LCAQLTRDVVAIAKFLFVYLCVFMFSCFHVSCKYGRHVLNRWPVYFPGFSISGVWVSSWGQTYFSFSMVHVHNFTTKRQI